MPNARHATGHPDRAAALVPSGMGIGLRRPPTPPGALAQAPPLDTETLFISPGDSLTPGLRERDPLLYDRYLRIRSTATRLEALRHPRARTAASPAREDLACHGLLPAAV
jgi:hypothetical protein